MSVPFKISSLTISPNAVPANSSASGVITLSGVLKTPYTAALTSSDPSIASVSASVTVPPGKLTAQFAVVTRALSISKSVTITVRGYGSGSKTAQVTVRPLATTHTTLAT